MNRDILSRLLKDAAEAHHLYEQITGKPDDNWADWYAGFMLENWPGKEMPIHRESVYTTEEPWGYA